MSEVDSLQRLQQAQFFIGTNVAREIATFKTLARTQANIIKQFWKIIVDELVANGYDFDFNLLVIKLNCFSMELGVRKHAHSKNSHPIWRFSYVDATIQKFPGNDKRGILKVLSPFLEAVVTQSGQEITSKMAEAQKELAALSTPPSVE